MKRIGFVLLIALLFGVEIAEAQRRGDRDRVRERAGMRHRLLAPPVPELGLRGAYDFEHRDFGVGAQAQIPVGRLLRLVPSGDVIFGEETTWQVNADAGVSLLFLRAGGGLALVDPARIGQPEGDPALGLNLFAGVQSPRRRGTWLRPYAEARWTFLDEATPFRLVAGANVPLGGARR